MNQLGVNNRGDVNLRIECSTYANRKPQREVLGCGAPSFNIPKSVLEYHLQDGFKIKDIASMLSVSESEAMDRVPSISVTFVMTSWTVIYLNYQNLSEFSLLWRGIDDLSSTRKGY